jgi:H+/gluconate symporter-like permease
MLLNIGYKKWMAMFGLFIAIIISLTIGMFYDLSFLEGAETMNNFSVKNLDEPSYDEVKPIVDVSTLTEPTFPLNKKKEGKVNDNVFFKVMEFDSKESFKCLQP